MSNSWSGVYLYYATIEPVTCDLLVTSYVFTFCLKLLVDEALSIPLHWLLYFNFLFTGNRTRAEDIRDHAHPYMRPGPFFPGQFPAANVQLLKDGRLAPTGMELGTGDPRLGTLDIGM